MKQIISIAMAALVAACSAVPQKEENPVQIANPASQYCVQFGGTLRIENTPTGQIGICVLPDGREVEEWELFRSSRNSAMVNVVHYECERGELVKVTYWLDKETAQLERNGVTIELRQQPSGSGFVYSNGPNTIRGKGDELTLEIGRMGPVRCRAK